MPTTVAQERATNPFVRATDVAGVRAAAGRRKTASVHERERCKSFRGRATDVLEEVKMRVISTFLVSGPHSRPARVTPPPPGPRLQAQREYQQLLDGKVAQHADQLPAALLSERHASDRRQHDRYSATAALESMSRICRAAAAAWPDGHNALVTRQYRRMPTCAAATSLRWSIRSNGIYGWQLRVRRFHAVS